MYRKKWFAYHFHIQTPPPSKGDIRNCDFVCPIGFGRNTWNDEELLERLQSLSRNTLPSDSEKIFRLREAGFDPGTPNRILATETYLAAKDLVAQGKTPFIIGAWEVVFALSTSSDPAIKTWYETNDECIFPIWPSSKKPQNTRDLLGDIHKTAGEFGLKSPALIAHQEHIARCDRLASLLFPDTTILQGWTTDFDPESKQPWTQNEKVWSRYEVCARFYEDFPPWARRAIASMSQ